MQIVDAIITREGGNSAWVMVVIITASGESVSVRLPSAVPCGGPLGRNRILRQAAKLLLEVASQAPLAPAPSVPTGRFGMTAEESWPDLASPKER